MTINVALAPRMVEDMRIMEKADEREEDRRRVVGLDFFCGAGGVTRGLRDAGVEVLAGVDNDERLRETYESNNKPSRFVCEDIRTVDIGRLRTDVGLEDSDIVVYAACTPCQPFSTLNQHRGVDDRKDLLLVFGRLVAECPPDFVFVENVPGLGNAYGREVFEEFKRLLAEAGLIHVVAEKVDAQDHGVPQVRKRFLLLASRHAVVDLPKALPDAPRTVQQAIGHFGQPVFEGKPPMPNHIARRPRPHHAALIATVPHDGGSRSDVRDQTLLLECHRKAPTVHKDVFGRMWWDRPSPTLTARCTDVYCGRFAHPEQDRGLSLREAAALQTFSDDYVFHGTFFHCAQQIGNAVPVALAARIGDVLMAAAGEVVR